MNCQWDIYLKHFQWPSRTCSTTGCAQCTCKSFCSGW